MKKIWGYFLLLIFSSFSFYLMQKTVNYIKGKDMMMLSLKEVKDNYYQKPIEAIIHDDTIIPGLNGYKVNIDKSYNTLKRVGSFNEKLLVYDNIKIKNKLSSNIDKYIIEGNKNKKMVSILLYLDDINKLTLDDYPLNYIVSYSFFCNHFIKLKEAINNGNNIIISSVSSKNIDSLTSKLNKTKQINKYCFNENKDNSFKDICNKNNYYSISSLVISNNYFANVKSKIAAGKIIVLKGNYQDELKTIINFIKSKGYIISNLDNHLNESM